MTDPKQRIIDDLSTRTWPSESVELIKQDGELALQVLELALHKLKETKVTHDLVLSHVPEESLPLLAAQVVTKLKEEPTNKVAGSLLDGIELMQPAAFHPYLDDLLALALNSGRYFDARPWRESGELHLSALKQALEQVGGETQPRQQVQQRLLETRTVEGLRLGNQRTDGSQPPEDYALWEVGYGRVENEFVQLDPGEAYHLTFSTEEIPTRKASEGETLHPTWRLPPSPDVMSFGGEIPEVRCGVCGGPLHQLLDLHPVPADLEITLPRVQLATCLSCLGWEREAEYMFFEHNSEGVPSALDHAEPLVTPQFPSPALKQVQIRLARTPKRWYWQDWGQSNGRENLHRVGGSPVWVQGAEYTECPRCGKTMHFLMELDSDLVLADGHQWLWGSGGLVYVFWCDNCRVSGMFWQCT